MGTEWARNHPLGTDRAREILVASNEVAVELSYLEKLWNRGVDIGTGVITSVFVGLIGLAFWRVKLWLDLRAGAKMQQQQHRIAEEFETEKRRQAARVRLDNLSEAMETLAKRAETVSNAHQLADCWEHYYQWLLDNQLYQIPGNFKIATQRSTWSHDLRDRATHDQVIGPQAQEAARLIRDTEVPFEE